MRLSARVAFVLLCVFTLLCSSAAFAVPVSYERAYSEAVQLRKSGDTEAAYSALRELVLLEPGDPDINFQYGLAAFLEKKYGQAQFAFIRVLGISPQADRVRLELARVYDAMKLYDKALAEIDIVLAGNPPEGVRASVTAFKSSIEQKTVTNIIHGSVRASYFYNSNANVGPSSREIETVLGGILTLDNASLVRDDFGKSVNVQLSMQQPFGEEREWALIESLAYSGTSYNEVYGSNSQVLTGSLGIQRSANVQIIGAELAVMDIDSAGRDFATIISPSVSHRWATATWLQLITRGGVEFRDYYKNEMRDSQYYSLGTTAVFLFGRTGHSANLGLRGYYEHAAKDLGRYTNAGYIASGGVSFRLPWEMRLSLNGSYEDVEYEGKPSSLAFDAREDQKYKCGLSLSKQFWTDGLSIEGSVERTDVDSNFGTYDYDKNVATVSLSYVF
ncbi:MAG: tetratricopeptide repeat protein [Desulfovibrio sp.]